MKTRSFRTPSNNGVPQASNLWPLGLSAIKFISILLYLEDNQGCHIIYLRWRQNNTCSTNQKDNIEEQTNYIIKTALKKLLQRANQKNKHDQNIKSKMPVTSSQVKKQNKTKPTMPTVTNTQNVVGIWNNTLCIKLEEHTENYNMYQNYQLLQRYQTNKTSDRQWRPPL